MIIPPIKIQGKKTKIVPRIMEIACDILAEHPEIHTWVEPFLGSGVVAFNTPAQIQKVVVNDINPHIIKFYQSISSGELTPEKVKEEFEIHNQNLMKSGYDYYNIIKDRFNTNFSTMDFLFLTRTGFNGVMRFNSKGKWNVPFCKINNRLSPNVIADLTSSIAELTNLFKTKEFEFHNTDFENIIKSAPSDSIFYCDPPYYGLQVQYFKGWGKDDELRLNELLKPRMFIYSTWLNDGNRDNPMMEYWSDFEIEGKSHKYNVAQRAVQRNQVIEGLIYKKVGNQLF